MKIDQIVRELAALNAAEPKKSKAKARAIPVPVAAVTAPKTNGVTHYNDDEALRMAAERIVRALALETRGVTADSLIEGVHKFEAPYQGAIQ